MRTLLKHAAERILVGSGVASLSGRRFRDRVLVLAYHNVLPDGSPVAGDRSLHLRRSDFARQLDHLAGAYDIVSIDRLEASDEGSGRPRVAITFDDAYEGALTAGLDEVLARKMPATIFVAPALLGDIPWWDILAERWGGVMPGVVRRHALDALGGNAAAILAHHARPQAKKTSSAPLPRIASEEQLTRASSLAGISIASHTWSHPNLCSLQQSELDRELTKPMQWLKIRFPGALKWISYPYGLYNVGVELAARDRGYTGALRIDGGWIPATAGLYSLPRLNIPSGLSIDGFRLRLAGL